MIMKTTNWLLGGLTAIAFTACTNDEWIDDSIQSQLASSEKISVKAYAPRNGNDTRVAFTPDNDANTIALTWQTKESFSVIRGSVNQTFSKETEGNTFEGVLPAVGNGNYYAIYPAITTATNATKVPYDLTIQTGALDSEKTYMYATSTNGTSFSFHHCNAILKATFTGMLEGENIKQLVVTTTSGKVNGTIDLNNGTMTGVGGDHIAIKFSAPLNPATTPVYIYLPPMAAESKTLTFEVTSASDRVYTATLAGSNENAIQAGKLYTAENIALTEKEIPYITFKAMNKSAQTQFINLKDVDFGLTAKGSDGEERVFQYSVNGGEWTNITEYASKINFEGQNSTIRLRGKSIDGTSTNINNNYFKIEMSDYGGTVSCTGDIRTLVDYEKYTTVSTANARFINLFAGCNMLTSAPELPATELADLCYYGMFSGCELLTSTPALPATTLTYACYGMMFHYCKKLTATPSLPATVLAKSCYEYMFQSCSNLTSAPILPATNLAELCYTGMFSNCTSLVSAPELPATTLANSCYSSMFRNCSKLVSAPELPVTALTSGCYSSMFNDCTSLVYAPELPATTLVDYCYNNMFNGCSSLNNVTMMATNISATSCLDSWLTNVASEGTFTKATSMLSLPEGENGIPVGWTVQNK